MTTRGRPLAVNVGSALQQPPRHSGERSVRGIQEALGLLEPTGEHNPFSRKCPKTRSFLLILRLFGQRSKLRRMRSVSVSNTRHRAPLSPSLSRGTVERKFGSKGGSLSGREWPAIRKTTAGVFQKRAKGPTTVVQS
jgi:hypothetical protein